MRDGTEESRRRTEVRRIGGPRASAGVSADATTFLTCYVVMLVAIPSRLTVPALGAAGTPAQLVGLVGLGWWAFNRVSRPSSKATAPVRTAMALFCGCVLVSFVAATTRPIDSIELSTAEMGLLSVLSWLGVLLVAHDGITDGERLRKLLRRTAVAAGLLGVFGLLQFTTGRAFTDLIHIPGLSANVPLYGVANRDGFARPAATALSPIEFGVFLTICLPLALHHAFLGPAPALRRWLPVAGIVAAIPLSISRSAVIGTVVVLAFLLPSWSAARRWGAALISVCVLLIFFVLVPGMLGSILKLFTGISGDDSALSRTGSYPLAWQFILRSPLVGRGFLTFLPKYRILDNQYLGLLIEMGVFGLLAVLGLFLTGIRTALRVRRASATASDRDLAVCLAAAVAAGAVSLAFFDAFSFPLVSGLLFLVLGCVGALARTILSELPPAERGGPELLLVEQPGPTPRLGDGAPKQGGTPPETRRS